MSDDDSSSSEDLPLSALARRKKESSESEAEFEEDEDDNDLEEESSGEALDSDDFIAEGSDGEDEDSDGNYNSDSSDDVPLSTLKSNKTTKTPPPKKKPAAKKKASTAKKAAPKKKAAAKKKATKKSAKAKQSSSSSASNYVCPSGELYAKSDKGKLIQSLLARWWYAYQWPDPKDLPTATPNGYDALHGFPGVYICTQGSDVGKFLDKRDRTKSPCFKNFAKKDAEELKGMLLTAIKAQRDDLIKHEGEGTSTEKELKILEKWAAKLNCNKADKEAVKVLKASKLILS